MYCPKCDMNNRDGAETCEKCGYTFEKTGKSNKAKNFFKRILLFICAVVFTFIGLFGILTLIMGITEHTSSYTIFGLIILLVSVVLLVFVFKENSKYLNKKPTSKPSIVHNKPGVFNENRNITKNVAKADGNSNVKYVLKGANGQLYVYENKVEITRKGVWAFANQGLKGTKTIPISEIKSIQVKKSGFVQGYIQFGVSGSVENQGGYQAANYDENTITFLDTSCNQIALNIKAYIEDKIVNKSNSQNTIIQPSYSSADELKKYKELLDSGVITQEEFDAKKRQLLGL